MSADTTKAIEQLNSEHWLKFDRRLITGCQCGFAADTDSDCGFGDSVVAHLLQVAAEAAGPVYYREAGASLRTIADADEKAEPPIGGEVDYLRGWRHAANLLDSTARDLEGDTE